MLCRRNGDWCSGRFHHLKEVCWSDPTLMFQRYKTLTQSPDSCVQQPRVLAPFYKPLEGMEAFFMRVRTFTAPLLLLLLLCLLLW